MNNQILASLCLASTIAFGANFKMKNGDTTFVSRRYVSEIKKILGI